MDKLVKTSLMVLFLTCSTILSAQTGKTTLKIVHYNVGVFSKEIENSIPMIAGMMKELDADVISLNELDSCNLRHDTYQLRDFAEEMGGWDYRFVNALPYKGGPMEWASAPGTGSSVPGRYIWTDMTEARPAPAASWRLRNMSLQRPIWTTRLRGRH